jgi:glucokinase
MTNDLPAAQTEIGQAQDPQGTILAIEIGGTKLQFGVGTGRGGPLIELVRIDVDRDRGAQGILEQIAQAGPPLIERHHVRRLGIGFGGPVDSSAGLIIKSHHVDGWTDFPIGAWCRDTLGLEAVLGNDSDLAGLGEARFGAGRGAKVCFYSNVGTGIGGSLVIGGRLYTGSGGVASELGHLRPGLNFVGPEQVLESLAAGWGIEANARAKMLQSSGADAADLRARCGDQPEQLTARDVCEAAGEGNGLALQVLDLACRAYGWALGQMITLLAPDVVVLGGGVSLAGEELFFAPVRKYVAQYVFPPLRDAYRIVPAELGEEVVLHGALALAAGE